MRVPRYLVPVLVLAFGVTMGSAGEDVQVLAPVTVSVPGEEPPAPKSLDPFYDRLVGDIEAGRPVIVTVYVALCDNDSQGIVPVKNPKICDGDKPGSNLYWATSGGLDGYLSKAGWKRLQQEKHPDETLAVRGVWRRQFKPGKGLQKRGATRDFDVYIVGLGYRGVLIEKAMDDFIVAVHEDGSRTITLDDGTEVPHGGTSHVVGYVGHDHMLDIWDDTHYQELAVGDSTLHKGVFALACLGDEFIRPWVTRDNAHILILNKGLAYPGAWTVGGIVKGIAAGRDGKGIHKLAAREFAEGKGKPYGAILKSFAWGD